MKWKVKRDIPISIIFGSKPHLPTFLTKDQLIEDTWLQDVSEVATIEWLESEGYIEKVEDEWPESWKDLGEIDGWWIGFKGRIKLAVKYDSNVMNTMIFATKNQVRSALAMAQLSQLMKRVNGDWKADWEDGKIKGVIFFKKNIIMASVAMTGAEFLAFPTEEIAQKFLDKYRDLIEKYFLMYK